MVDNRSAGYFGIGGAFNFKSGDISGTAAKLSVFNKTSCLQWRYNCLI